jgi:hypothetical protein
MWCAVILTCCVTVQLRIPRKLSANGVTQKSEKSHDRRFFACGDDFRRIGGRFGTYIAAYVTGVACRYGFSRFVDT